MREGDGGDKGVGGGVKMSLESGWIERGQAVHEHASGRPGEEVRWTNGFHLTPPQRRGEKQFLPTVATLAVR